MCVGLSAKVLKLDNDGAIVESMGAKRKVSADLLEDLEPGDYVMVHAGAAIAKITSDDIEETDELFNELFQVVQVFSKIVVLWQFYGGMGSANLDIVDLHCF